MGEVATAIARVLENGSDLAARDIHLAVEELLGEAVQRSTVKNCLARGAEASKGQFRRVSRGRYRLADTSVIE
jgi:hypothetical protein